MVGRLQAAAQQRWVLIQPLPDSCAAIKLATIAGMSSGDRALWLAQPKSIPFSDELYDLTDIGVGPKILLQFLDPLLQRAVFTKELVDRLLHGLDLVFREPAAFQPNKVEARKVRSIA